MRLRYIEVRVYRVHKPLAELLRQKSSLLESLTLREAVAPLDKILGKDWGPLFPKLEALGIFQVYFQDEFKVNSLWQSCSISLPN